MGLHPSIHARTLPDKIAYRMAGSGAAITYGELDRSSSACCVTAAGRRTPDPDFAAQRQLTWPG